MQIKVNNASADGQVEREGDVCVCPFYLSFFLWELVCVFQSFL